MIGYSEGEEKNNFNSREVMNLKKRYSKMKHADSFCPVCKKNIIICTLMLLPSTFWIHVAYFTTIENISFFTPIN